MKQFDLEKAKAGAPIQTRNGRPGKFIAYVPEAEGEDRVIILVDRHIWKIGEDGRCGSRHDHPEKDIFMAPVKREGWVNVYETVYSERIANSLGIYNAREQAEDQARTNEGTHPRSYIDTVRIEWEEK